MSRTTYKDQLPPNVVSQNGRLYFNKHHKGVRYNAPFDLVDSPANRKHTALVVQQITTAMKLGTFNPNDYPLLKRFHTATLPGAYPTFEAYIDTWLDRKSVLAPATIRTYRALIKKHLLPYFGARPINEINKPVVEQWLAHKVTAISRIYTNECLRRLKSILYDAEADFDLNLKLDRVKAVRSYDVPIDDPIFTLDEASALYMVSGPRLRTMMLCSMFGGLRTGEVIALKREDVDFKANRLRVRATMSEGGRKAPKSWAGRRDIPIHPVLRQHLAETLLSHQEDFVFISQRGKPFSRIQNFEREFKRAKELAEVRDLRWYAFRKLFASIRYACSDAVPAEIARDMGHTDIALSLNTYSEAMPHLGCRFEDVQFPIVPEQSRVVRIAG